MEDYTAAIEINPNYCYAYCNRGLLKSYRLHDYGGALKDYNKAV